MLQEGFVKVFRDLPQYAGAGNFEGWVRKIFVNTCLLYTSDAADERSSVDLGGRRIIKKKNKRSCDEGRARIKKTKESETQENIKEE